MRVPTLSEIKQEIKKRVSYIHALAIELLKVQERCAQASNKYFDELDTFLQEALLAGLDDTGKYSENALALLYRDIVGIELANSELLVRLLRRGEQPKVRIIYIPKPEIWRSIKFIEKISKRILDIVGTEFVSVSINKPIDFAEKFTELINELIRILPQFNNTILFIWSLADNIYWYLSEVSKPENNIYPNLLELKDVLEGLGLKTIRSWNKQKYEEYKILGYEDYATAICTEHSLKFSLFNLKECNTLGGSVCKLIELSYELLRNLSSSHLYTKWFINIKDFEREIVLRLQESIDQTYNIFKPTLPDHREQIVAPLKLKLSTDLELSLADLRGIRHRLFIDQAREDGSLSFGWAVILHWYDNNLIVRHKIPLFDMLDLIAPFMFLRLIDLIIVMNENAFVLLSR
ncbi:MAG: hypothetical protein GXO26_01415 [Crenarchaeota archaeon]|nr:hypothetical protein [Thermoproteota archaeon]